MPLCIVTPVSAGLGSSVDGTGVSNIKSCIGFWGCNGAASEDIVNPSFFSSSGAVTPIDPRTESKTPMTDGKNGLSSFGSFLSGADKFTVASSTGNTAIVGTLDVTGTLGVTGLTTLSKGFNLPKVSSTLASTALAVTSGWHEITASGNALTTLTGGTAGQLLLITVAGTDLVVTDTAVAGGSNTIVGGVTLDLSEGDTLLLMFDGTQWRKIAHGDN